MYYYVIRLRIVTSFLSRGRRSDREGANFVRVIRVGSNQRYSDLSAECGEGAGGFLLLIIKTAASIQADGIEYGIRPNTLLILRKNNGTFSFSGKDEFICDWIRFDMTEAEAISAAALHLPFGYPAALSDSAAAASIIRLIAVETLIPTAHSIEFAESMMQALFLKLSATILPDETIQNGGLSASPYSARLTELRNKIYATPEEHWTIERMCREMNISRTHLHRLYAETFGVTCYNDVLNSKMEHAKHLLSNSSLPIHEISERCAFDNDVSFMRCFKKATGMTPTQYRSKSSCKV